MKIVADANIPFVRECFCSLGHVELVDGRGMTPQTVAGADALLVRSVTPVGPQLLDGSAVRFVGTATIGYDHVEIDYLRRRGIAFASAPGSNANSAAEYVIAALLEIAARRGIDLRGSSIGIIGAGNVGSRVAEKCTALGMELRLNDPPLARETGQPKYLPIEALFDCDFVTLHTPLTFEGPDKTYHLADAAFFRSLKKGCIFVNASRGAVVEAGALKAAILGRRLGAVVLDVWENEPQIDTQLVGMVDIGTPHIAGYSLDGKVAGMMMIYHAACDYFGATPNRKAEDFLPAPPVPELTLEAGAAGEQQIVATAVKAVYDIARDDARLRLIRNARSHKTGEFFDNLRKEYPVRREFQNTSIVLSAANPSLRHKLAGVGFTVES